MRQEDIPPHVRAMLAVVPVIERHEKRWRKLDWAIPIVCFALVFIQDGSHWYGQAAAFMLGARVGALWISALQRRRSYRILKQSTEDLELEIALRLEHDDG